MQVHIINYIYRNLVGHSKPNQKPMYSIKKDINIVHKKQTNKKTIEVHLTKIHNKEIKFKTYKLRIKTKKNKKEN